MAGRAQSARENGKKGGRPRGSKNKSTLAKEAAREYVRQRITAELDALIDAALSRATGLSYLVTREARTGRYARVPRGAISSTQTVVEVWEKEPDIVAIRELLDRALDKPKEQTLEMAISGDWEQRAARLAAARKRVASYEGRTKS